mgnify:CR=1 FL=1
MMTKKLTIDDIEKILSKTPFKLRYGQELVLNTGAAFGRVWENYRDDCMLFQQYADNFMILENINGSAIIVPLSDLLRIKKIYYDEFEEYIKNMCFKYKQAQIELKKTEIEHDFKKEG